MMDEETRKELAAKYLDKAHGTYDKKRKPPRKLETTPAGIQMAEKRAIACEMRKEGNSWLQIAVVMECDVSTARRYVKDAISELVELTKEDVEDIRELELNRLDAMYRGISEDATSGDLDAIDRALKIQERRSKYLGLDSASKMEVTGKDGEPILDPRELLSSRLSELSQQRTEGGDTGDDSPGTDPEVAN